MTWEVKCLPWGNSSHGELPGRVGLPQMQHVTAQDEKQGGSGAWGSAWACLGGGVGGWLLSH